MTRKIPRSASWEDLMALPEGVWHEAPEGLDVRFTFQTPKANGRRTVVPLSKTMAKRLGAHEGEKFSATVQHGKLILDPLPPPRTKKARRA
jgi:hypothetical protein